eukprot:TRINITY_DN9309_c0_g1_i1.p3 TRINITY_DN9309_c0_g1~~TRINITY_DN9309_c0_g1_i1.p3  ORF type:complete len:103 (+),score=12.78 TRINITY_DN9309_c0_g1_i1:23-310(+)
MSSFALCFPQTKAKVTLPKDAEVAQPIPMDMDFPIPVSPRPSTPPAGPPSIKQEYLEAKRQRARPDRQIVGRRLFAAVGDQVTQPCVVLVHGMTA